MKTAPSPILRGTQIVAGYLPGVDILHGVDIDVDAGEIVCIVGPNGAGKSTLLKALFGLVPLRSGRIDLMDRDVTGRRPDLLVGDGAAYVPQAENVFANLTVERNLQIGAYQRPAEWLDRWQFACETFPVLEEKRHVKAGLLSGGQRQMVAMARALMMRPRVLLLDEPTAGLSPIAHAEVFDLCASVNASGVSILIVEQNARHALAISHRGYVLDQGRVALSDTGSALLQDERLAGLYLGALREPKWQKE